jgi:hypothetical protein
MPIAYLDVPQGIHAEGKKKLVRGIYNALNEAYPFPPDHRIFLREWPLESVSQDGQLGSETPRPACLLHAPQGVSIEAKRKMVQGINAAVAEAYNNLSAFIIFTQEYPLDLVAVDGKLHSDNQQRVEQQQQVYGR